MSHSRLTQLGMSLVRRHPVAAGFVLVAIGLVMGGQSLGEGAEGARFARGSTVTGEVLRVEREESLAPRFRLHARWRDAGGGEHVGSTRAYRSDARRLQPGDSVALRMAAGDPGVVVMERIQRNRGLLHVGGVAVTPLVFAALLLVAGGSFLVITGDRFQDSTR